jgi:hypothetical protein
MIGVSASALQRIELGKLRLSGKIAERIAAVTDVAAWCLTKPNGRLVSRSGHPYTARDFDRCQSRLASPTVRHECEHKKGELRRRIDTLLDAALARRRFALVESDLWEALNKIRAAHGLKRLSEDLLRADGENPRASWNAITSPNTVLLFHDHGMKPYSIRDPAWSKDWDNLPADAHAYLIDNHGVVSSTVQDAWVKALLNHAQPRTVRRARRKRAGA